MPGLIDYFIYLHYVLRHKWHVARHCFRHRLYWRGITHDLSKLLPSEFFPYARYNRKRLYPNYWISDDVRRKYQKAWSLHKRRNDHHPENWEQLGPNGDRIVHDMSRQAILEMICDWESFHTSIPGRTGAIEGYREFGDQLTLSLKTRQILEEMLSTLDLTES